MNEPLFQKIDKDTERGRALAKVYRFLLKLAEEAENRSAAPDNSGAAEQTDENTQKVINE